MLAESVKPVSKYAKKWPGQREVTMSIGDPRIQGKYKYLNKFHSLSTKNQESFHNS